MNILNTTYYGNTVAQWTLALLIILASVIVAKLFYWISTHIIKKLTAKTKTDIDDLIVDMAEEPLVAIFVIISTWYSISTLSFTETVETWIWNVFQFVLIIVIAWMITRMFDSFYKKYLLPMAQKSKSTLDDELLPIVRRGTDAVIWVIAIIIALNNAGYNVNALIAGLGIGGIAFAMAAKDTISNIFGGVTIFTDHPFKVGDRIQIDGFDGTVKEVGIRSTRLETLQGRIVTIPNSKFADNSVENVSLEPTRKIVLNLGLTYDTKPQKMELAMKILKEVVKKNKKVKDDALISFNSFGDFALGILCIYYIKKGENILEAQTEVNMEILKRFNKEKLEFAFPTQTIYT
jgi:MscS family membrane protein